MFSVGVIFLRFNGKDEIKFVLGENFGGVTAISPAFADDVNGVARLLYQSSSS